MMGTTTMKMIKSTSTTSTSGVMLISECRWEPSLWTCMISVSLRLGTTAPRRRETEIMHVQREGSHLHSEINITPLVDVVLVLLIIFMVVVPIMLKGYDVSIPRSSAEVAPAQAAEAQVILSIVPASCHILGQPAGGG